MVDPWDADRLYYAAQAARAESQVFADYWSRLEAWLVEVVRAVIGTGMPDPVGVWATVPAWDRSMREHVYDVVAGVMADAWRDVTGYEYDSRPRISAYLATVHNRMVRTPDEVFDRVASEVAVGAGSGESIPEIRDRIQGVLDDHEDWRGRAETVARTETIGALNAARDDAFDEIADTIGGTDWERMWLSTIDARTRPTHRAADRQRSPLGGTFQVGGFPLTRPGDPFGPPQEVINCRCTVILVERGEDIDMSNRQYKGD